MRINIHEIPPSGLDIMLTKSEVWVRDLFSKSGIEFGDDFNTNIQVFRAADSVVFNGSLIGNLKLLCSRCGKPFTFPAERNFTSTYCKSSDKFKGIREEVKLTKDDLDLTFFSGEEVDLVDVLNEQIQLAIPYRPLCQEDCKGLCPYCGKDLNDSDCKCEKGSRSLKFSALRGIEIDKRLDQ